MPDTDAAGELRHRVIFQRPSATVNEYGEQVNGWATVVTVWASVKPLTGRELLNARQVQANTTHQIAIRDGSHVAEIAPTWRAVHKGRVFAIESVTLRNEITRTMRDVMATEQTDGESRRQGAEVSTV